MITVPLPFVVSLFLAALLFRTLRQGEADRPESRLFLLLITAYTVQSVLIGIRWGYGVWAIMPVQAVLAVTIAALAWVCFRQLAAGAPGLASPRTLMHGLPALVVAILFVVWRGAIDTTIILVFLFYGGALLWLARRGPDSLVFSRLDGVVRSYRSLQLTALALIGSALADIVISFDFAWGGGRHAAAVVATGNVLALLVLGAAAVIAGQGAAKEKDDGACEATLAPSPASIPAAIPTSEADAQVAADLDTLMRSRQLYRDADLNLSKIARRMHLPVRQVSGAINRVHGISVSQYVNNFRVEAACRMLAAGDDSVTRIAFEAGFQTKSNFNREFLRMTGLSPTAWRRAEEAKAVADLPAGRQRVAS